VLCHVAGELIQSLLGHDEQAAVIDALEGQQQQQQPPEQPDIQRQLLDRIKV
jgi:hypothetical protein